MSEQQMRTPEQAAAQRFKERVTALIGIGVGVIYGAVALIAAYTAISGSTSDQGFQQLKDILTFMSGLMGTVVGYYFGRVGVENRAEAAESTMQWAQTAQREAERQAAQAVAKLDVEAMAREALEKGKVLAEQAQEEAETKLDQMDEVMTDVTQGMQSMRERVQAFKAGLDQMGAAAAGLGSLVLGAEEEGDAPPPVDTQELDDMATDIDAMLQKMERVQH